MFGSGTTCKSHEISVSRIIQVGIGSVDLFHDSSWNAIWVLEREWTRDICKDLQRAASSSTDLQSWSTWSHHKGLYMFLSVLYSFRVIRCIWSSNSLFSTKEHVVFIRKLNNFTRLLFSLVTRSWWDRATWKPGSWVHQTPFMVWWHRLERNQRGHISSS